MTPLCKVDARPDQIQNRCSRFSRPGWYIIPPLALRRYLQPSRQEILLSHLTFSFQCRRKHRDKQGPRDCSPLDRSSCYFVAEACVFGKSCLQLAVRAAEDWEASPALLITRAGGVMLIYSMLCNSKRWDCVSLCMTRGLSLKDFDARLDCRLRGVAIFTPERAI